VRLNYRNWRQILKLKLKLKLKNSKDFVTLQGRMAKTTRECPDQESILPNFVFFIILIFAFKLGHFKEQTILSYATNTQA
jgi:hypothetical protein